MWQECVEELLSWSIVPTSYVVIQMQMVETWILHRPVESNRHEFVWTTLHAGNIVCYRCWRSSTHSCILSHCKCSWVITCQLTFASGTTIHMSTHQHLHSYSHLLPSSPTWTHAFIEWGTHAKCTKLDCLWDTTASCRSTHPSSFAWLHKNHYLHHLHFNDCWWYSQTGAKS